LSITTLSIKNLYATFSITALHKGLLCDIQHNDTEHNDNEHNDTLSIC
jgi:hypothetical protein